MNDKMRKTKPYRIESRTYGTVRNLNPKVLTGFSSCQNLQDKPIPYRIEENLSGINKK